MALYGYKESPKLLSDFRDDQLAAMKIPLDNSNQSWLILDQMVTEQNMWRILKVQPGPFSSTHAEQLMGLLLVYAHDLLILGDELTMQSTIKASQMKWETSIPKDLLVRSLGEVSIPLLSEPETRDDPPGKDAAAVKEAQHHW